MCVCEFPCGKADAQHYFVGSTEGHMRRGTGCVFHQCETSAGWVAVKRCRSCERCTAPFLALVCLALTSSGILSSKPIEFHPKLS